VLQQSLAAMGGNVPADSVATGTVTLTAGGRTDVGTVRILTKGTTHTAEEFKAGDVDIAEVYADGIGAFREREAVKDMGGAWACSSLSAGSPVLLLAVMLSNPDTALEYVGEETVGAVKVHHVRAWNTYASKPKMKSLAEFSVKDIWIASASGLPLKVAFERREGGGATPRIPVEFRYADYRNVGGALYPLRIEKFYNGSLWARIQIESVSLNTGLTYAAFPTFSIQ
jgi:hypothetical protein